MGTRMDHPDALYHHLGGAAEGITFSTTPKSLIRWSFGISMAVQHRGVALIQAKKSIRMQNPDWFPGYAFTPPSPTISFGPDIDRLEEQDGWVFVQEGNAYAAFRVVFPAVDTIQESAKKGRSLPTPFAFDEDGFGLFKPEPAPYTWKEMDPKVGIRTLEAKNPYAAMVVEASRKPHHATLEAFKKDVSGQSAQAQAGHRRRIYPDLQGLRQRGERALSELRHPEAGEDRRRSPEL